MLSFKFLRRIPGSSRNYANRMPNECELPGRRSRRSSSQTAEADGRTAGAGRVTQEAILGANRTGNKLKGNDTERLTAFRLCRISRHTSAARRRSRLTRPFQPRPRMRGANLYGFHDTGRSIGRITGAPQSAKALTCRPAGIVGCSFTSPLIGQNRQYIVRSVRSQ